jgi:hypothetical protein
LRQYEGNRAKGKIAEGAHYLADGIGRQGERKGMRDSGDRQRFKKKKKKKDIRATWRESRIDSGTFVSRTIMYRCTLSHVGQTAGELGI